jgi:hypothetical protein
MSAPPPALPASLSTSGYQDGLGRRSLAFDRVSGSVLERLIVRPELLAFERDLRQRADHLATFDDERIARVRDIEHDGDARTLTVVSEFVGGRRLSDLLDEASERDLDENAAPSIDQGLGLLLQLLPALSALHTTASVTHGVVGAGRIAVTPAGEIVLLDNVYGPSLERLQLSRRRLWTELRVAPAPSAGLCRFDVTADIAQAALAAAAITVGRPLGDRDYPDGLRALLNETVEIAQLRGSPRFATALQRFFERALPLPGRRIYATADEANLAVQELVAAEMSVRRCRAALTALVRDAGPAVERDILIQPGPIAVVEPPAVEQPVAPRSELRPASDPDLSPVEAGLTRGRGPVDAPPEAVVGAAPIEETVVAAAVEPPVAIAAIEEPVWAVAVEPPVAIAPIDEPVVAATIEGPVVAVAVEEPVVAAIEEPVLAVAVEPPVATAPIEEPVVAVAVEAPPVVATAPPPPAARPAGPKHTRSRGGHRNRLRSAETPVTPPPAPVVRVEAPIPMPVLPPPPAPVRMPSYEQLPQPVWAAPEPVPLAPMAAPAAVAPPPSSVRLKAEAPTGYAPPIAPRARAGQFDDISAHHATIAPPEPRQGSTVKWTLVAAAAIVIAAGVTAGRANLLDRLPEPAKIVAPDVEPVAVTEEAPSGSIAIETQPDGARVLIDGKAAGETPLKIDGVAAGSHIVTLITESARLTRSVKVEAGKTSSLDVPVYSGWLAVFSPIALDVGENGHTLGSTEQGRLVLPPGRHTLTLSNKDLGYSIVKKVDIESGEERALTVQPRGTISLNAVPWAEVYIDGKRVGETPLANVEVPLGTCEILFKHPQFGERRVTEIVTAIGPSAVSVDFTR